MYLIHFFNEQGRYQVPIYQEDANAVVEVVFAYKHLVPRIRVTQSDEVVFETERGAVVWPEIDEHTLGKMADAFPAVEKAPALAMLPAYREAMHRVATAVRHGRSLAFTQLRAAEIPLLAYAASKGLNLFQFGYQPAEIVIAEAMEAYDGA